MNCRLALLAMLIAVPASGAPSAPPAPFAHRQLDDPAKEAEARDLMETLRCLTCQSQSIADSDADIAGDMRHHVRLRIASGDTPDEVRRWLIARYGDYVSYAPAPGMATWPLFAGPVLLLLAVVAVIARRMRRR